jgi:hypothetical protein
MIEVLRRPVESALASGVRMMNGVTGHRISLACPVGGGLADGALDECGVLGQ